MVVCFYRHVYGGSPGLATLRLVGVYKGTNLKKKNAQDSGLLGKMLKLLARRFGDLPADTGAQLQPAKQCQNNKYIDHIEENINNYIVLLYCIDSLTW